MPKKTATQMVEDAKKKVENISIEDAAEELKRGEAFLVDVRESEELREHGVIPGAVHAPRGMLEFYADPTTPYHREGFDPERRVILHCASGGRSALAAETLQELGYRNVANLDGGFTAWKEKGCPVDEVR